MVITIASWKGGQAKSTTAIHLGAYYQQLASTIVIDHDPNRTTSNWAARNQGRKFCVVTETGASKELTSRRYEVVINDTPARPEKLDLAGLVRGSDLVIIPVMPDWFSLETLRGAAQQFKDLQTSALRILLTNVPPPPQKDGREARAALKSLDYPVFKNEIRSVKAFKHAQVQACFVQEIREDPRSFLGWTDYEGVGEEIDAYIASVTGSDTAQPAAQKV